ncbi:MAG TPA: DUF3090 domain-containing protein [Candidatus Limnocylindria bacterium]|nr:DUF3090 domain-containing protein [Candidatus Limnocylindria bacterium]
MARQVFTYDPPERFVVGTVGEPGQRTFYLQARAGSASTSVALEKQQVLVLAERVEELLDEVLRRSAGTAPVPAVAPADLVDLQPLEAPVTEEFRVGAMSLAWEPETERVVIEAGAVTGEEDVDLDDDENGPDILRVCLTGAAARAFVKRALAVVSAGRPPCPFCELPLEPEGHICPRQNGYRRRA